MRVILTNPETGHAVAVDDWHVEYWEGQGYAAAKPAAKPKTAAKKTTAKKR